MLQLVVNIRNTQAMILPVTVTSHIESSQTLRQAESMSDIWLRIPVSYVFAAGRISRCSVGINKRSTTRAGDACAISRRGTLFSFRPHWFLIGRNGPRDVAVVEDDWVLALSLNLGRATP